jgi:hypothetical protein
MLGLPAKERKGNSKRRKRRNLKSWLKRLLRLRLLMLKIIMGNNLLRQIIKILHKFQVLRAKLRTRMVTAIKILPQNAQCYLTLFQNPLY